MPPHPAAIEAGKLNVNPTHQAMQNDELDFLEDMLASTELLHCATCNEETLHAHAEVVEVLPVATELKMECTHCQTLRSWIDWSTPQLARNQS